MQDMEKNHNKTSRLPESGSQDVFFFWNPDLYWNGRNRDLWLHPILTSPEETSSTPTLLTHSFTVVIDGSNLDSELWPNFHIKQYKSLQNLPNFTILTKFQCLIVSIFLHLVFLACVIEILFPYFIGALINFFTSLGSPDKTFLHLTFPRRSFSIHNACS